MKDQVVPENLSLVKTERRIPASAVSRGVGIGRVILVSQNGDNTYKRRLSEGQIETEIDRLRSAVSRAVAELNELISISQADSKESASDIFGVHLLMIESSPFIPNVEVKIVENQVNAEWAVKAVSDEIAARQRSVSDRYLSDKHIDVKDVADRIIRCLGRRSNHEIIGANSVIVVVELMPSQLLGLAKSHPVAIISEHGGWTSHTSILARELEIPLVTGVKEFGRIFTEGDEVIVDGINGQVIVDPTLETIEKFSMLAARHVADDAAVFGSGRHIRTLDGHEILIRANADMPSVYRAAERAGANGIGLYRSEIIFNQFHDFPSESEQLAAYNKIASSAGDAGVRIRTFDVGVGQLAGDARAGEHNPSLGLKSIRLSLTSPEYFRTQIRAIFQASFEHHVDIVLPMISGVSDIVSLRKIIEEERADLQNNKVSIGDPGIGVMIEIPSAVITAPEIARHADFMCLGTNDLVQYLLAVDRDNEAVADWYQTLHPAVIRSIREVIAAGKNAGIPVTVCGEIAGSAFYVPVLIGLGASELSMNVISLSQIRRLISGITLSDAMHLVDGIMLCETADQVESILRDHYLQNWGHLFPPGLLSAKHQ